MFQKVQVSKLQVTNSRSNEHKNFLVKIYWGWGNAVERILALNGSSKRIILDEGLPTSMNSDNFRQHDCQPRRRYFWLEKSVQICQTTGNRRMPVTHPQKTTTKHRSPTHNFSKVYQGHAILYKQKQLILSKVNYEFREHVE